MLNFNLEIVLRYYWQAYQVVDTSGYIAFCSVTATTGDTRCNFAMPFPVSLPQPQNLVFVCPLQLKKMDR